MNKKNSVTKLLKNPILFQQEAYINGQWVTAQSAETLEVYNPATQQLLGKIPNLSRSEIRSAIESAQQAYLKWRTFTAKQRSVLLCKWRDLILDNQDDLALLMTLEQGKPLLEAKGEIVYAASFLEWFAEEGKRVYGETIPNTSVMHRSLVIKEPVGVCTAITPWNFPSAMITRKVAPALAVGCTTIIKPAEETPFSALALAVLAQQAGIPEGVFNVVTGRPEEIGVELTQNPMVRKFSFTGSTAVGKQLMAQCASTVKKISLELGGNAPFIVFEDADIDKALKGAIETKFFNAGQVCISTNRFYVQEKILETFTQKLIAAVKLLNVGDGTDLASNIGPLINIKAVQKIEKLLDDATKKGAKILLGGKRNALGGSFFEPTIITGVTANMDLTQTELFGPVAAIISFKDEAEVINAANDTVYGLAAYLYTQDFKRIWRCSESLEYGMVGLNSCRLSSEATPFGGMKQSGIGREGSHYGIEDYIIIKYLDFDLS